MMPQVPRSDFPGYPDVGDIALGRCRFHCLWPQKIVGTIKRDGNRFSRPTDRARAGVCKERAC